MAEFRSKRIRELVHQLMVGPPEVRRVQADRLEGLLAGLEPDRVYPYEFLYFRITGFRPEDRFEETYPGRELLADLARALEMLSRTVPRPAEEAGEPVHPVEEVAGRFNVSVRTVRRWRRRGLVGAYYLSPDGRAFLGVRRSALERFEERTGPMVARAERFSRLSAEEGDRIIARARRLVEQEGLSPTAAAERVADEVGRATETVRRALLSHEREEPVLGPAPRRLSADARRRIYVQYSQGVHVDALAGRYGRSRSTIYRVVNRERAAEALCEPVSFVEDEGFSAPRADERILGEEFRAAMARLDTAIEAAAGAKGPWRESPLSAVEERILFRAYNYLRFRAAELRRELDPSRYVPSALLGRLDELKARAEAIRSRLIRLHVPLFRQVARQHLRPDLAADDVAALGRAELGRLVDSFRYQGRARFPAYANLELMKGFARAGISPDGGD